MQMSHRVVAPQTSELPATRCRVHWFNSVDNFLMTGTAGLLGYLPAVRFDLNIVLVTAVVKKNECQKPFDALVAYLPMKFTGVWQLLQVATERWDDLSQPSNCSRITWQLAQAAGSSVR
jgi:hypothetical protein